MTAGGESGSAARGVAVRIAVYFAAMYSVSGVSMPYLNLWFASHGLSIGEIAIIAAINPLVRMVAGPSIALAADLTRAHRTLLIACGCGWAAAWLLQSASTSFRVALAAQALVTTMAAGVTPLTEAIAVLAARGHGIDYGRVRVWGSVSFIAASIAGGWLVDWRGIGAVIWLMAGCAIATAVAGFWLPKVEAGIAAARRITLADTYALVSAPQFLLFLAAAGLTQSAHATLYVFGVIHWQALGISNGWCGALWAISVLVEIGIFLWGSTYLGRLSPVALMGLGAAAAVVRWLAMAADPPLALLVVLQALHGLTYGAMHLGAIQFLMRAVPEEQSGTAQGLYSLVTSGIGMAVASSLAGAFYVRYGGLAYVPMAVLAMGSLLALALLRRRWDGGQLALAARP